ncbi:MAG TPA: EAL domain-containing protein [Burkholderiaceae bacterium]|nr:EAL domain-containing protein [Burkholderiaceae bacterium]
MCDADKHENLRLDALRSYAVLDTPPEEDFDCLTRLAADLCEAPMAAISLIDSSREWFKSVVGFALAEVDRSLALGARCLQEAGPLILSHLAYDPAFAANPLVSGRPRVRFYAGIPLVSDSGFVVGALGVMDSVPRTLGALQVRTLQALGAQAMALLELRRWRQGAAGLSVASKAADAQYRLLFDSNPHPMWVTEAATRRFLAVNRSAVEHYGYSEAEFLSMHVSQLWLEDEVRGWSEDLQTQPTRARFVAVKRRHRRKDGTVIEVEVSADAIQFDGKPARLVMVNDVTERQRAERELTRISRAQRMLGACNEALVRATSEGALLKEICRITVEIGGYRVAWIGFAHDDAAQSIMAVAHAGANADFMKDVVLSWSAEGPYGQAPASRTVREGVVVIVEDIARDEAFSPWLDELTASGFRSVVTLPLRDKARTFGLLYLYASEVASVGADEVKLLTDMANDLAFGITNLRSQEEQRRTQAAVLKVAAAVSTRTGVEFFEQLAHNMAEALGAQAAFVSRLLPGEPKQAITIAAVVDAATCANFQYLIEGTPCEEMLSNGASVVPVDATRRFPRATKLAALGAQAYAGRRLDNSAGEPMGQLFVLFREPLRETEFIASTLQIFAARVAAEMERQESDTRIRDQASLLDKARDAILVRGMDHRILFWNRSAERLYGWAAHEVLGRSAEELLYEEPSAFRAATDSVLTLGEWTGEITQRRKDGAPVAVEGRWTLVKDDQGAPQSIFMIDTDITQRKAAELKIQRLAFYDPLTGLPNRLLLMDRLQQALAASHRSRLGGALLFIDLDNFKTLNDTLGHDQGDLLLQQIAARLMACVRETDTVARLGGDEFVVMLEALGDDPQEVAVQARAISEKVLSALSAPCQLAGGEHQTTASIGIAPFRSHQDSVGELLKQADIAMYQAKAGGRNTLRFFDPGLQAAVTARAALETDLRQALVQNEFLLHYQPQLDGQGRMIGAEALARWRHPRRGLVSPAVFIPLAEETGLILQLGRWVLREACTLLAQWAERPETEGLSMAVNVSAKQFRHPDFAAHVTAVLNRTGANPERLKLELTESLLVEDMDATIAKMTALKAKGVGFSLDDFGTGYSSLAYLKRLPLDQLKIDQSFVRDVLTDHNDAAIARTIIALGRSLGLAVIAEGVETIAQRDFLADHGCDAYQGYLFSKPLAQDQLDLYILAGSRYALEGPEDA